VTVYDSMIKPYTVSCSRDMILLLPSHGVVEYVVERLPFPFRGCCISVPDYLVWFLVFLGSRVPAYPLVTVAAR
jgi:hypothetical protein